MKAIYNVTGSDRKRVVGVIARTLDAKAVYQGMPSMAYQIGAITVDKEGTMIAEYSEDVQKVLDALSDAGFTAEIEDAPEAPCTPANQTTASDGLTISLPLDGFNPDSLNRLQKLVDSKASLIRKATGASRLTIRVSEDKVAFPWWDQMPAAEETQAYMAFIAALCSMAKQCRRVAASEKPVESERYAFRAFLLRLGFVGAESKAQRKILLAPLSGSAAFPTQAKAEAFAMVQKAKRNAAKAASQTGEVSA